MRMIIPGVAVSAATSADTSAEREVVVMKLILFTKLDASARLVPVT